MSSFRSSPQTVSPLLAAIIRQPSDSTVTRSFARCFTGTRVEPNLGLMIILYNPPPPPRSAASGRGVLSKLVGWFWKLSMASRAGKYFAKRRGALEGGLSNDQRLPPGIFAQVSPQRLPHQSIKISDGRRT